MVSQTHRDGLPPHLEAVAEALGVWIEGRGGRGGDVVVTLRGFGSAHHLIELPPATPDVWRPIVERELRRLAPDISEPIVAFADCGTPGRGTQAMHELLAAAVPRETVELLRSVLAGHRIRLAHLTVLPQALRRAFRELVATGDPTVLVVALDAGPLVCFFYDGELRLVVEPPPGMAVGEERAHVLRDAIERGALHLRQQHRGVMPQQVLVAAAPGEEATLSEDLQRLFALQGLTQVRSLGAAGVVTGVGAVCDAGTPDGLDLRGQEGRKPRAGVTPLRAVLGGAVAAAALWALIGGTSALVQGWKYRQLEEVHAARVAQLESARPVLEERRAHHQRLVYAATVDADYTQVEHMLRMLGAVVPDAVQLQEMTLARQDGEWLVQLGGTASGASEAAAVTTLQSLNRDVQERLRTRGFELSEFDYLEDGPRGGSAVLFRLSFAVPEERPAS